MQGLPGLLDDRRNEAPTPNAPKENAMSTRLPNYIVVSKSGSRTRSTTCFTKKELAAALETHKRNYRDTRVFKAAWTRVTH